MPSAELGGNATATQPADSQGRRPGERFGLILAVGAAATAALAALSLAGADGPGHPLRTLYVLLAAVTATVVLILRGSSRRAAVLNYRLLACAVALSGAGMLIVGLQWQTFRPPAFLATNGLFIAGTVCSLAVIMPALYRNLDREHLVMAVLDGGILWVGGMTLMLTLWRAEDSSGGPERYFAPLAAAALLASGGTAVTAAFAKRWAPSLGGVWCGLAGVIVVGLSWVLFVDSGLHGRPIGSPACLLYAGAILLVTYGWVTWTDDRLPGEHDRYDRFTQTVSDWLPMVAILLCINATALPHSRMIGTDVTWAGTAMVMLLTLVRQKVLVSRERAVTERLVGEERLRAEKDAAEASDRAKSKFLAMMSHEIRTPLNAILGFARLLDGTHLDDGDRESVGAITVAGETLQSVINDVLDFSKIEANQMRLERVAFEVAGLVRQATSIFTASAHDKKLALTTDLDAALPSMVSGDPVRLRQILYNLIGNAIKFTPRGSISLHAILVDSTPEWSVVRFEVTDTGVGIGPEERSRLFEPFVQADVSTTRRFGGTGLGLAICRSLVGLMGGEIGVESEKGAGSTFWFTVRLARPSEIELLEARSAGQEPTVGVDSVGARVLAVDDNAANLRLLERMLELLGVESIPAQNGRDAISEIESGGIDLVLMDIHMPVMDGLEATRVIRSRGVDIPIVAVTADATSDDRSECREAGMNDFLSKPIRQADLVSVLRTWLPSVSEQRLDDKASGDALTRGRHPDSRGVLDQARIEELEQLDPDGAAGFMAAMVDSYRSAVEETLPAIRAALVSQDAEALEDAAHKLKGVAGNVGVSRVFETSARLVDMARAHGLAGAEAVLADLEAAVPPAALALEELLAAAERLPLPEPRPARTAGRAGRRGRSGVGSAAA